MGAKGRKKLGRNKPKRKPYDRVLIVCEGDKTEKFYFGDLIRQEQLSSANVEVIGSNHDSAPKKVLNKAIDLYEKTKGSEAQYDKVFCVIDRDEHESFNETINKSKDYKYITMIVSYPCIEYWFLCHFKYTRATFCRTGDQSPAIKCIEELNKFWENTFRRKYSKGEKNIYNNLYDHYNKAYSHAKKAKQDADKTNERNPSSEVYILTDYLKNLRN